MGTILGNYNRAGILLLFIGGMIWLVKPMGTQPWMGYAFMGTGISMMFLYNELCRFVFAVLLFSLGAYGCYQSYISTNPYSDFAAVGFCVTGFGMLINIKWVKAAGCIPLGIMAVKFYRQYTHILMGAVNETNHNSLEIVVLLFLPLFFLLTLLVTLE